MWFETGGVHTPGKINKEKANAASSSAHNGPSASPPPKKQCLEDRDVSSSQDVTPVKLNMKLGPVMINAQPLMDVKDCDKDTQLFSQWPADEMLAVPDADVWWPNNALCRTVQDSCGRSKAIFVQVEKA